MQVGGRWKSRRLRGYTLRSSCKDDAIKTGVKSSGHPFFPVFISDTLLLFACIGKILPYYVRRKTKHHSVKSETNRQHFCYLSMIYETFSDPDMSHSISLKYAFSFGAEELLLHHPYISSNTR